MNLFYEAELSGESFTLSAGESKHIVRVLRMKAGDDILFTDGKGFFYECRLVDANPKACAVEVIEKKPGDDKRPFYLHLAVAPTKNLSRFEWFLEKATEIGIDRITPIICAHSERKVVKTERLNRVVTAAMKQSLKSFHPVLDEPLPFSAFIETDFTGQKFIAYIDESVTLELSKVCTPGKDTLVLIGPEGDFSPEEVALAKQNGFIPVRLGPSRLRTETAGVVACHTVNVLNL
ncbi:MAG: 16S rRNA (uracil(1498)-N(3))-methyltransferase [Bacteroidales bacterium]|nr:16S rRNA (uracil(1498)-N(3))-methyltransferase [Bacteroidales bacterium]